MTAGPTEAFAAPQTIVLIHGLWMTPRSWEQWIERFESRGHTVIAPAWKGMEAEVEAIRADPDSIAGVGIKEILDNYEEIIRGLDSPPIIMGHSFGGGFTQVLLDRGLGSAGVGVAPATVKGVLDLPLSTIRATFPVLRNPFSRGGATALNAKQFRYGFANTLSQEESDKIRDRYAVPAVNRVLFEGAFTNFTPNAPLKADFASETRAPLLFIGFSDDHIVPAKTVRHNAEKYKTKSVTAYKEFEGRPHFPGAPGWEEVADYALDWALDPKPTETG